MLSAKRIARRALIPFALLGSVALAVYSVGAAVYLPHLFSTYSTRYGVIGAVFAMISALFCVMVVVVGSAAAGREIHDELDRIRRGEQARRGRGPPPMGRGHRRGAVAVGDAATADPGAPPSARRALTVKGRSRVIAADRARTKATNCSLSRSRCVTNGQCEACS